MCIRDSTFILNEYEITLPCAASEVFAASPPRGQDIDYTHQDYLEGVLPLPIRLLHFRLMDPQIYHSYWEYPPPAGALINISTALTPNPSQKCEHYNAKEIWCKHNIIVSGTDLMAGLHFNGGQVHALSAKKITPENRPWEYYPEESWPQLYDLTERFVKSFIK